MNKSKLEQDELIPFPFQHTCKWYEQQEVQTFTKVRLVLNEDIKEPSFYNEVLDRVDRLTENDYLVVEIDTNGGNIDGAIAIMDAIENTQAEVIGVIKNKAYSVGSAIALTCPNLNISPNTRMMIHSFTAGYFGKDNELEANFEFNQKYLHNFMGNTYKYFLTEKEISELFAGKDIWLDADQVLERLEKKNILLQKEYKKLQKEEQDAVKKLIKEEESVADQPVTKKPKGKKLSVEESSEGA